MAPARRANADSRVLAEKYSVYFEPRGDASRWPESHRQLFQAIEKLGTVNYNDDFAETVSNLSTRAQRTQINSRALSITNLARTCSQGNVAEATWRAKIEGELLQSFAAQTIHKNYDSEVETSESPDEKASGEYVHKYSEHFNKNQNMQQSYLPMARNPDHNEDYIEKMFSELVDVPLVVDPLEEKELTQKLYVDRVVSLRRTHGFEKALRMQLEETPSHTQTKNQRIHTTPFGSATRDEMFPFLIVESRAPIGRASVVNAERKLGTSARILSMLQHDLNSITSPTSQFLDKPLVWCLLSFGSEWRVAGAYIIEKEGISHCCVSYLWMGDISQVDDTLQLLLILEYILNWARNIYRPSILSRLLSPSRLTTVDAIDFIVEESDMLPEEETISDTKVDLLATLEGQSPATFSLSDLSEPTQFVGREKELNEIHTKLRHGSGRQIVVIHGLGGMGKTQLAIAYAKRHKTAYSGVFWLDIHDEDSLKQSLFTMMQRILLVLPSTIELGHITPEATLNEVADIVKAWLSRPQNRQWLMIFDQYDTPKVAGVSDKTAIDIRRFLPEADHGSILVTTRSSRVDMGHHIKLTKLTDMIESIQILSERSHWDEAVNDPAAQELAKKLDGLPLALATAQAYLKETSTTFPDYLRLYQTFWLQQQQTTPSLTTYQGRSLYTTWNVSLRHIEQHNMLASQLLRFWAYFDHQDLWYDLLREGQAEGPEWLTQLTKDELTFTHAMRLLCNFGLVEAEKLAAGRAATKQNGYSMHGSVHEWVRHELNAEWNREWATLAITTVARHITNYEVPSYWFLQRRLIQHVTRCCGLVTENRVDKEGLEWAMHLFGDIYAEQGKTKEAEEIYLQALRGKETALGPDHTSTLDTVNNLGNLYTNQGKMVEAEEMYLWALRGKETALGPKHPSTLNTVNNLGNLYADQGKMVEAEEMYQRALRGYENAMGPEHTYTLDTVNNLGNLYTNQGKMVEAEEMYLQALRGYETALGPDHTSTLSTFNNLGNLYANQSKMEKAEEMYLVALQGYEKVWGQEHTTTLRIVRSLVKLYVNHGRMKEAEQVHSTSRIYETLEWSLDSISELGMVDSRHSVTDLKRVRETISIYQKGEATIPYTFGKMSYLDDIESVSDLSDVSSSSTGSLPSLTSDSSLPSSMPNDNTEHALQEFASALFNNPVLRPLYERLGRLRRARFISNHDILLYRYFRDLRHECRTSDQKDTIRLLRGREQRNYITSLILDAVGPHHVAKERATEVLLHQKSDRRPQLESFLASKRTLDVADSDSLEEPLYRRHLGDMEKSESSDESEDANQYPNLDHMTEFLTESDSFSKFQSNFRCFLKPPKNLVQALEDSNIHTIERYITENFVSVAKDQYDWLWEVDKAGYSRREIAELLLEEARDAPWIIFVPEDIGTPPLRSHIHVSCCGHSVSATVQPATWKNTSLHESSKIYSQSDSLRYVEEFCGLGGVAPSSPFREMWNGTVSFEDGSSGSSRSYISYKLDSDGDGQDDVRYFRRISNALTGFCRAAALMQSSGFCCDCFIVLVHKADRNKTRCDNKESLDLHRVNFFLATDLLENIDAAIAADMISEVDIEGCAILLQTILGDLLDTPITLRNFADCSALAVQFLSVALLSYLQGHAGPIDPFFLETAQTRLILMGTKDPCIRSPRELVVEADLVSLTCLGQMINQPVLAFCAQSRIRRPTSANEDQYDVTTSIGDLLDTWGPGHFIYSNNSPGKLLAVGIRGGYIFQANAVSTKFHWSRDMPRWEFPEAHFTSSTHLLVGASAMVNPNCPFVEGDFRRKHSHFLKQMGTHEAFWSIAERQFGLQAGNYASIVFNETHKLNPGRSLKSRYFHPFDWLHLSSDINHTWGLQVSLCTGIARRVRLRDLLADLLPKFIDPTKRELWGRLKNERVVEAFESANFADWLQVLDTDLQCYLLALVRSILEFLKETGFNDQSKRLIIAWPVTDDLQRCLEIPCEQQSRWVSILSDSPDCATFAYATTKCLVYENVSCQNAMSWGNSSSLLATAISCADLLEHGSHYWVKTVESMLFVQVEIRTGTVPHIVVNPSVFHQKFRGAGKRIMQKEREKNRKTIRERQTHWDDAEEVIVRAAKLV